MYEYKSQQGDIPDTLLDQLYIQLLKKFSNNNSDRHKLFGSYMSIGQKYENELLVIGTEPSYLPSDFSAKELNDRGAVEVFKSKVLHLDLHGNASLCPQSYVTDLWGDTETRGKYNTSYNSMHDPFWQKGS